MTTTTNSPAITFPKGRAYPAMPAQLLKPNWKRHAEREGDPDDVQEPSPEGMTFRELRRTGRYTMLECIRLANA